MYITSGEGVRGGIWQAGGVERELPNPYRIKHFLFIFFAMEIIINSKLERVQGWSNLLQYDDGENYNKARKLR